MGRGGRFGGKESPHWRAKLHGTVQDKPHPTCSKDRTGCTGCTGCTGSTTTPLGNLELLMKKISIQHHQQQQHQHQHERGRISGRGWTRLGRGKGAGKRCSINAHECLCMGYPNRDIPKRGMPHREHEQGQEYCTVLYILHICNPQRSAAQE